MGKSSSLTLNDVVVLRLKCDEQVTFVFKYRVQKVIIELEKIAQIRILSIIFSHIRAIELNNLIFDRNWLTDFNLPACMQWDYRKLTSYRFCYFSVSCLPWRNNGRVAWQKMKVPRIPFKTKFGAGLFSFQNCHFWRLWGRWHLASLAGCQPWRVSRGSPLDPRPGCHLPSRYQFDKNGNSARTVSGLQPEVRTILPKSNSLWLPIFHLQKLQKCPYFFSLQMFSNM